MKFEKKFDLRNPLDERFPGPRFCVHVVDGPGEEIPGRIRTLRFDYNCDAAEWLKIEWESDGHRRTGIKHVNIAGDHAERGSFFLAEAFDQDPDPEIRTEGKKYFQEWALRAGDRQKVEAFPDEWLPQRVHEARKSAKEKAKKWSVPKRTKAPSAKS